MCSPVPYSKPRRGKINRDSVVVKTAKGSRVYAPGPGVVRKRAYGLEIVGKNGVTHQLHKVTVRKGKIGKKVRAGARVAKANGKTVVYRKFKDGEQVDAMGTARKDNCKKSPLWMPGVKRMPNGKAGDMSSEPGDEIKAVIHTTESGHAPGTINGVAAYTTSKFISYHLLWNPWTGELVQMYPADVGARSLANAPGLATNRHGKKCIQVSLVGRASEKPIQGGSPMKGRRRVLEWLDFHGVPRTVIDDRSRSQSSWKKSGYHTHASCPSNNHYDPGPMSKDDWNKFLAP